MANENNACFRNTRQKKLILDCLKNNKHHHLTAEDMTDVLKANKTPVGKATVYRYLAVLESTGQVRKYNIAEKSSACYEYICDCPDCNAPFHLICRHCGEIFHFQSELMKAAFDETAQKEGLMISSSNTLFSGICKACFH